MPVSTPVEVSPCAKPIILIFLRGHCSAAESHRRSARIRLRALSTGLRLHGAEENGRGSGRIWADHRYRSKNVRSLSQSGNDASRQAGRRRGCGTAAKGGRTASGTKPAEIFAGSSAGPLRGSSWSRGIVRGPAPSGSQRRDSDRLSGLGRASHGKDRRRGNESPAGGGRPTEETRTS